LHSDITTLQLTNKDKRAKCEMVFSDPEVLELLAAELGQPGTIPSNRVIAEYVGVSAPVVGQVRKEFEEKGTVKVSSERTDKKGRTIKTANIGTKGRREDGSIDRRTSAARSNSSPNKPDTSPQISENLSTQIDQPAISENLADEMSEVLARSKAHNLLESKLEKL
jgi:DNA-binding Lrp family transcriptional regulator